MPRQSVMVYTRQINLRLSEEEYQELKDKALAANDTVSSYIRNLIKNDKRSKP